MHELFLHGDPVAAPRPRVTKNGTHYPKPYKSFHAATRLHMLDYMGVMAPLEGPVTVHIAMFFRVPMSLTKAETTQRLGAPHTMKPDCDNLAKSIMDAGNGILWADDAQIAELLVTKRWCNDFQPAGTHVYFDNDWIEL